MLFTDLNIDKHRWTVYFAKTTNIYEKVIPAIYRMYNIDIFCPSGPTMVCIWANLKLIKFYRNFSQNNFENLTGTVYKIIGVYPATLALINRDSRTSILILAEERNIVKSSKHHLSWRSNSLYRRSQQSWLWTL